MDIKNKLLKLTVNGNEYELTIGVATDEVKPSDTLAHVLRDLLGLTGTKISCNKGECGACTVLVDGTPTLSCSTLAVECHEKSIVTIEGICDLETGELHPLQQAFIEEDAIQCGMCTPGITMSSISLLENNDHPTENEVRKALAGNICRCTGYVKYAEGVLKAAKIIREKKNNEQ